MVLFKINGERNSGTNFLTGILRKNGFSVFEQQFQKNNGLLKFWKHGVPDKNVKLLDNRVIDIFIFRDLNDWLVSMFKNPWHLKPSKNFKDFLTNKQICIDLGEYDFYNKKLVNYEDEDKTIFEMRYNKIKKIYEYRENNPDIVFVNLTFLQNDEENVKIFIQTLSEKYLKVIKNNIITSMAHTKNNSNLKNRIYEIKINDYKKIVDTYKDENIENSINNLTFEIKEF
jgi:hypothetical protein